MTPAALARRLDELKSGLEGLLSCFESERYPAPDTMDVAWSHVLRGFEEVRDELTALGRPQEELEESVHDCLRLYAVATGVLAQRREELAAERSSCTRARAHLRRLQPGANSGDSCDVRG